MAGLKSALYVGRVTHHRRSPFSHRFSLPFFMSWLDLGELDRVFEGRWLWSARRRAFARFDRRDHLGPHDRPLDEAVRDLVEERLGRRPEGPIRLLTHLRTAGLRMNPLSLFYCYDASGEALDAVVAEVTNTPWDERHCYVLDVAGASTDFLGGLHRIEEPKSFHVSPFMPMSQTYTFVFDAPADRLRLRIESRDEAGRPVFEAGLALQRRELTGRNMAWALLRYPFVTAQVAVGIHVQALLLWLRGATFFSHPAKADPAAEEHTPCRQATSSTRRSSITS